MNRWEAISACQHCGAPLDRVSDDDVLLSGSTASAPDLIRLVGDIAHRDIPFPTGEQLKAIVLRRLPEGSRLAPQSLDAALRHFEEIRELALKKKPATAELLVWLRILEAREIDLRNLKRGDAELLALSYCALAKSREDRELIERNLLQQG